MIYACNYYPKNINSFPINKLENNHKQITKNPIEVKQTQTNNAIIVITIWSSNNTGKGLLDITF